MYERPRLLRFGRVLRVTRGAGMKSGEQQTAYS